MAITYGFYNSVGEDRLYDAEDFATFFDGLIGDGIIQGVGQAFQVTADSTRVRVAPGRAWFDKTWTYNDSNEFYDLVSASTVNPRIDTLVLEVDKRAASRINRIIWVLGTPGALPFPPTLIRTTDHNQYPLADVYRPRDVNTVTTANITNRIGSSDTPWATNTLVNIEEYRTLAHKRGVSRGNNLGSTFTTAQRAAIRDGSFEGLFLGDYWMHAGVRWRIVDFDYWYGRQGSSGTRVLDHHIVIVPDDTRPLRGFSRWFTSSRNISNCGWGHSTSSQGACEQIRNASAPLFGSSRFIQRGVSVPLGININYWIQSMQERYLYSSPMNTYQLHGTQLNSPIPTTMIDTEQFALYKLELRNIWGFDNAIVSNPPFWLIGNYDVNSAQCQHDFAGSYMHSTVATVDHYERPVFAVHGA